MRKTEGTLLVHAIGGGDLGMPGTQDENALDIDLEGAPRATGKNRRPLRKVFEGLAAARLPVSDIALLGTTDAGGPAGRPFADHADAVRARLVSETGLCGGRYEPEAVSVVRIDGPTLGDTTGALRRWLTGRTPDAILVTCGSGAFAVSAGALCAALETRRPTRILDIETPDRPYVLALAQEADPYLESWLVRHRFWDALAQVDQRHRFVWELLAARQAGSTKRARSLSRDPRAEGYRLTSDDIDNLSKPWPTAQAALFERLGRGEAADQGLLRAWFTERLFRYFDKEKARLPVPTGEVIGRLVEGLGSRNGNRGNLAGLIRTTRRDLSAGHDSAAVKMIHDAALGDLYGQAATHEAHLSAVSEPGPLPQTLLAAADDWERRDPGNALVAATGRTGWPVLGSGDVLGLMAVGLDRDGRDAEDRLAVLAVLAALHERRGRLLRPGTVRLRLLASPETADRAHRLARGVTFGVDGEADVRVIEGVRGDLASIRDTVTAALTAEAVPSGSDGPSGPLREVDEVMLVLNPGPPMTNYGMIAAGVRWSLTAACPLWVTELARGPGKGPEVRGGRAVPAGLGADRMLTALAASAVRRLDLRTARQG